MLNTRRVITGRKPDGTDAVIIDERVRSVVPAPGVELVPIWAADTSPTFPISGVQTEFQNFFPPPAGYRFVLMTIPPGEVMSPTKEQMEAYPVVSEADIKRVGKMITASEMDPDHPGMHATDTVDLEIVISGEAALEMDGGEFIYLKAGDCIVQNGTRHRWFNRTLETAVVAIVLIGGHRESR